MKPYKPDKLQKITRNLLKMKYECTGGGKKLFNRYAKGVSIKNLSDKQQAEAIAYWKELTGKKIDTRWHQLLYSKTGVFTPRYMPFEIYNEMITRQNPSDRVKAWFDDKCLYRYLLRDFKQPKRIAECYEGVCYLPSESIVEVSFGELVSHLSNISNCVLKPSKGSSAGRGVRLLEVNEGLVLGEESLKLEDLLKSYNGNFVIEEKIEESECLSKLNPSSCNTLRIHTWRNSKKEKCEFISAYVRIGRAGKLTDNASSGGITCEVVKEGKLGNYPCSVNPYSVIEKTDAGVVMPGYLIYGFDEMVDTAVKAHSCLPMFGIIGWDICIDKNGTPIIIEFNPDPDLRIEQLVFRDTCLLDKQDEMIKEIFKNH